MKRSRAFLLFGVLSAMVAGYVAWCSRPFYLRAPLPYLSQEWTEEFCSVVLSEIEVAGLRAPEEFSFKRFVWLLANPYDSSPSKVHIIPREGDVVFVGRSHKYQRFLMKFETGWERIEIN